MTPTSKLFRVMVLASLSLFACLSGGLLFTIGAPIGPGGIGAAQASFVTPTPEPTSTPPSVSGPQVGIDLKSELFWGGGGAGPGTCLPNADTLGQSRPVVFVAGSLDYGPEMNSGLDLCILGLPTSNGDTLLAQLFDTSNNLIAYKSFVIQRDQTETGRVLTDDDSGAHVGDVGNLKYGFENPAENIDYIRIKLSILPALPSEGFWTIVTPTRRLRSKVLHILPDAEGIVIRNSSELFSETTCRPTIPGEVVHFAAFYLPPNQNIPFGLYIHSPSESSRSFLIAGQFLRSDARGVVQAAIQIPFSAPRGVYFLVASLHPDTEMGGYPGPRSCDWTVDPTLAYEPPPPFGTEYFFYESFDGSELNLETWGNATTNDVVVAGGVLQLSSAGNSYPFVTNMHTGFPYFGDFRSQVRFRYPHVDTCGVGVMMVSEIPLVGLSQSESGARQQAAEQHGVAIGVWQDRGGMQLWYRAGSDRRDIRVSGIDTNMHTLAVEYSYNQYKLYLDDVLMYTSMPTFYRPSGFWIGNPVDLGQGARCNWDTLQVDQIQVTRKLPASESGLSGCAIAADGNFYSAWSKTAVARRLGCPLGNAYQTFSAEERFQGGSMLWHQRNNRIYAIYADGTWASFVDPFVEGVDPMFVCGTPSSPPSPVRGFSRVWCGNNSVRTKLGNATEPEIGYCMPGGRPCEVFQDFPGGMVFYSQGEGAVVSLFNDGTWTR